MTAPEVSQERLAGLLLNSTGEGIYGIDLEGKCTFANPACARILGFDSPEELLGEHMHNLVHHTRPDGEPYPEKECRIYQAFRLGEGTHVDDEVMFRKDGSRFEAEYWSHPVVDGDDLIGCVLTFVDITERKKVRRELEAKERLVRSLLESSGEGIYGIDLTGCCTFANPACAKILGFDSPQDLLGQHMHRLVHHTRPNGQPYPETECRIYQAFRDRRGTHVDDEVMFRKDGSSFQAEYWSYPVEQEGELVGCVLTFIDITERRRVEEELRQTEKLAALGKLSAGLAHELNNPAAAAGRAGGQLSEAIGLLERDLIGLARLSLQAEEWDRLTEWIAELQSSADADTELSPLELSDREQELVDWLTDRGVQDAWDYGAMLARGGFRTEGLEQLAEIVNAEHLEFVARWIHRSLDARDLARTVERSSRAISELVGVVKSYSHMDRASVQRIDVHDGIDDTITILHHKLKHGYEVIRNYDRSIPQFQARGSELNQVWTNLIDNAINAMPEGGTISLSTRRSGTDLIVAIADNGPGIPEEIRDKIFDPFFTTKGVSEGTGLGLDVVRRIVTERCGGEITLESGESGTTFTVSLPIDEMCDHAKSRVAEIDGLEGNE